MASILAGIAETISEHLSRDTEMEDGEITISDIYATVAIMADGFSVTDIHGNMWFASDTNSLLNTLDDIDSDCILLDYV